MYKKYKEVEAQTFYENGNVLGPGIRSTLLNLQWEARSTEVRAKDHDDFIIVSSNGGQILSETTLVGDHPQAI